MEPPFTGETKHILICYWGVKKAQKVTYEPDENKSGEDLETGPRWRAEAVSLAASPGTMAPALCETFYDPPNWRPSLL
jgi:hypothetical protein